MPLIALCFSLFSALVKAENIKQLSSYLKINKIVQDSSGYIWFAGQNGLIRFDGTKVINFSSHNDKWSIPYTWIHDIIINGNDFIIVTESDQLWRFTPETGHTQKIKINLPNKTIKTADLYNNEYFFKTISNQVYKFSPLTNTATLLSENLDISHIKSTSNDLFIAGRGGLYKLDENDFLPIFKDEVLCLSTSHKGLIAVTEKSVIYIGDDGSRYETANIDNHIRSTKSNDNNLLLINKNGEVSKLSVPYLTKLEHHYPKIPPLVPNEIMQDSSNTIWISSNKGIQRISSSPIKNHEKIYDVVNNANEIELFDNELIVGTYGDGIHTINKESKVLSSKINNALPPLAKKTMDLLAIENDLYIATFDGLWIYNKLDGSIKKADILKDKLILKLTKNQNLLYIATNASGLFIYDLINKVIINHIDVKEGLSSSEVIDTMTLDNHNIWLATANGINMYNIYTKESRLIKLPGKNKVISLATFNNKIYAATKGDGIFVLNFHGDILSRIAKGIDFSMISAINDEIWAPAQQGLYRINTEEDSITLVPNTEQYTFTDRPVLHNNIVYVPHYKGMLEVPVTEVTQYNPRISISEVTISGASYLVKNKIEVNSENDVISLTLASLDFRSGTNKEFKYQINGGQWNKVFGNQLTLTGLQSGNYKLVIQGTNSLGQWSQNKAFTEIIVAYPWYLTSEIKILYLISISFIIIVITWILYLRFRSIRHIHTLLSNDIKSHSKLTFNIERNLKQVQELLEKDSMDSQTEQLHQASLLINECIDSLTQDENETEPKSIQGKSLEVALPYFINYVQHKYHSNINLQIDIPESRLSHEMQADIYKIIYETIISTIINGSGRNFEITIQEFKQKMWLTITNDEKGFSKFKNKINFDMSMYYIRQISSKYNASFNVFDKENNGSQLIISIPLMNIS